MNKDFCIFILTHGRPDKVITYYTLKKSGCTYPIYFIIDNEDKTADKYYENFGRENVIMFDKLAISKTFDTADNFDNRKCIIYARNFCFEAAKKLGYKYFLQLDDDYTAFDLRFNFNKEYSIKPIKNLNKTIDYIIQYYKNAPFTSLALAQGGDYLGGADNGFEESNTRRRKCMNTFFCSIERPFKFIGRINEYVNTYTSLGKVGHLFNTIAELSITQLVTQTNSGGMTETYLDGGTYLKSFYTVMIYPSAVKCQMINANHKRLHHKISWINAVPMIISEDLKKN